MEKLSRVKLESMIKSAKGKFISVTFVKKNGEVRKLHGRTGVTKDLRGGVNKVVKDTNSYITVWDKSKQEYRTVNLDTVSELHMCKHTYKVEG